MEPEVGKYVLFEARTGRSLEKIIKITPTMIRCEHNDLDRETLRVKGLGEWDTTTAHLITDEQAQALKRRWLTERKARKLKEFDFTILTEKQIEDIYNIIGGVK